MPMLEMMRCYDNGIYSHHSMMTKKDADADLQCRTVSDDKKCVYLLASDDKKLA